MYQAYSSRKLDMAMTPICEKCLAPLARNCEKKHSRLLFHAVFYCVLAILVFLVFVCLLPDLSHQLILCDVPTQMKRLFDEIFFVEVVFLVFSAWNETSCAGQRFLAGKKPCCASRRFYQSQHFTFKIGWGSQIETALLNLCKWRYFVVHYSWNSVKLALSEYSCFDLFLLIGLEKNSSSEAHSGICPEIKQIISWSGKRSI